MENTEQENAAFLNFLSQVRQWIETPKLRMVNFPRMNEFQEVVNLLMESIENSFLESDVILTPCPLETGDISVSFELCDFTVHSSLKFAEAIKYFQNIEIYPLQNGNIRFAAVFANAFFVSPLEET